MGNLVAGVTAQRIIGSLDLLIGLGLGISVRVGDIQTIFLDLNVVVLGSRNLHIDRDDILVRDSNRGGLGSTTGVNIHQSSSGNLDNLAGADGQLDLLGRSIVSAALDNHILAQIDGQLIAAKHRHLDGAGLGIIGGRMDNTSQRGGNRGIALGNTQDTSIIGDIGNKHTLTANNLSHLATDIIKSAALFYLYDNKGNRKNGYLQTSMVQGVEITEESNNCDTELCITTLNSIFILTPTEPKQESDLAE